MALMSSEFGAGMAMCTLRQELDLFPRGHVHCCRRMAWPVPSRVLAGLFSPPDPHRLPAIAQRRSPVLAGITGAKTPLRSARCLKAVQKQYDLNGLSRNIAASGTPRTEEKKGRNSGAKSDNRGATGWIRQCRSIPRDPYLSEVTSGKIRCEFGNIFVGRECEDHLGRPPAHERRRAARVRPTPAATAARSARRRATPHRTVRPRYDSRR
jgi:hypothetical protein